MLTKRYFFYKKLTQKVDLMSLPHHINTIEVLMRIKGHW